MTAVLLILAALGWLSSVLGAVVDTRSRFRLVENPNSGMYVIEENLKMGTLALLMIVGGASFGAAGTILAVLVTDS